MGRWLEQAIALTTLGLCLVLLMAGLARAAAKPILHVSFGPGDPAIERALAEEGIPSFPSAERALQAYARVRRPAS